MTGNVFYLPTLEVSNLRRAGSLISRLQGFYCLSSFLKFEGSLSHADVKKQNNTHFHLGLSSLTVGTEEGAPQSDPLFRLTSDGTMLSELLSTLETGDPTGAADPNAPLFSQDTINALLGEQLRETAARIALEVGHQQQQPSTSAPRAALDLQTVLSGNSTSSMMSLQDVTTAMQTHHQSQMQTLPQITAATVAMTGPISQPQQQHVLLQPQQQQQQQQQYITLLDGRVLQQPDGSAVLASVPSGQQPLAVALPGSSSVLQYIPVLNSQVVTIPQIQIQVQPTAQQQQQQQQQQLAAMAAAATLSGGGGGGTLSDGSGAVLPTTSSTPPATTPTSAAAASAAVYTSEISTTQQLVATAAAQQQWLQQEAAANAAASASPGACATNAANVAMREATAAMADVSNHSNDNNNTNNSNSSNGLSGGQVSPTSLAMPPPPPRPPRLQQPSLDAMASSGGNFHQQQQQPTPSLTPQLRPATTEPFSASLASAVLAAAHATNASYQHDFGDVHAPKPLLRPVVTTTTLNTTTEMPEDGQLPRKPSHKRERSLRSASPALADPSTAPTIKCAKGHNDGTADNDEDIINGFGTSPDSCILAAQVAVSVGGSSGDVSPLNGIHTRVNAMPEPPLAPQLQVQQQQQQQQLQQQQMQPALSGPGSSTTTGDANNDAAGGGGGGAGGHAAAAGNFEVDDDVVALMQAALAPKTGKRRGRPPGSRSTSTPPVGGVVAGDEQPREPTEAEILEIVFKEDPSRRQLPVDEIKKLVRKEKNRISAAISRNRNANYTAALESRVKALQAEQAELSGWLQAPPQGLPHRVLLVGPAAAAAAMEAATGQSGRPPIRHLSL